MLRVLIRLCLLLPLAGWPPGVLAQPQSPGSSPVSERGNFASILEQQLRAAFDAIAKYVAENPDAADLPQAYAWLFETARLHSLEAEAVPLATQYLQRGDADADAGLKLAAQRIRSLGLARQGKLDEALADFDRQLRSVRLRSANETLDYALALVAQAQLSNNLNAAREILERLSAAFFLNAGVRELCDVRLAKFDLIGKAPPEIGVADLQGARVDLADFQGKVVLVDFWATNCPPCLEEFPRLKQLYAEYRERGFEVVGISLDDSPEAVAHFQETWKLPWRLILDARELERLRSGFKVVTIPATYVIDRQGKVAFVDLRGNDLRRAVARLLDDQATTR